MEVLAHRIVNTWLAIANNEIIADRTDHANESTAQKHHLPENHTVDDKCPTEPFPFACPCSRWSASYSFKPIDSAALIISPKGLLTTWLDEFCRRVDRKHPIGRHLKMWVAHGEGSSLNRNMTKLYNHDMKLSPSINDLQVLRRDRENHTAKIGAHFITVLTTSGSYRSQLGDLIRFEIRPAAYSERNRLIQEAVTKPDLQWGFIYRDEFHKEKKSTSSTPILIEQINNLHLDWEYPILWFLSRTPFKKGPSDLEAYISLLESEEWLNKRKYKRYTNGKVIKMGKCFEKLVKHPGSVEDHQEFIS